MEVGLGLLCRTFVLFQQREDLQDELESGAVLAVRVDRVVAAHLRGRVGWGC